MKPQAQILIIATFLYGVLHYVRTRDARPLGMMASPILLFLGVRRGSRSRCSQRSDTPLLRVLPWTYLNVSNVMPALTAQMTNIWYPFAYFLRESGQSPITVSDRIMCCPIFP